MRAAWAIFVLVLGAVLVTTLARAQTTSAPAPATTTAPAPLLGQYQDRVTAEELPGTWITDVAGERVELHFRADRTFHFGRLKGTYTVEGNHLTLVANGSSTTYEFDLDSALTLRGGDLRKDLKLTRLTTLAEYFGNWFEVSPAQVRQKLTRMLIVLAIMLAARMLILGLKALSTAAVYSNRGPLKFAYRYNKRRVRTFHLLTLNIVKYIIYFTALGFILSELGVNYTAYIASLSVVGLAIGFGSQGLVQDMVTGFFVIFEAQFDVGDLIDVSGQTGVVTEFGLRTTILRNYVGQTVVIPNRNIAMIANYGLIGLQCTVDIAVESEDPAARKLVEGVTAELRKQFVGIIIREPAFEGPIALASGGFYLRVNLAIWPGQQWMIDQQFVPRIREAFARESRAIPGDRIVSFYHLRKEQRVDTLADRLQRRFHLRTEPPDQVSPGDDTPGI